MRVRTHPRQPFLGAIRNAPPRPAEGQPEGSHQRTHINQTAQEWNEALRVAIQERQRFQLTSVWGFIGILPQAIGLMDEGVREGRRVRVLPSQFKDPLFGRNIVSPFLAPDYLVQYHVSTWEY